MGNDLEWIERLSGISTSAVKLLVFCSEEHDSFLLRNLSKEGKFVSTI
jgi:hypothetical protein